MKLARFVYRVATQLLLLVAVTPAISQTSSPASEIDNGTVVPRTIALTFDDLPMAVVGNDHIAGPLAETQYINASMLRILRAHHATALGLVNEVKLNVQGERDARVQILESWLDAGMLLGNHGYSHREFNQLSLEQYEEEFLRGDVITSAMLEKNHIGERFFRPPYLDAGDTPEKKREFERFLKTRGYRMASYTIQNQDWMFDASYEDALRRHDTAGVSQVCDAYLAHITDEFEHAEQMAEMSFHRMIPQIMFMHADLLNADTLDSVLTLMERRGYSFIPITTALTDPVYMTPEAFVGRAAISWLDRWQPALGRPIRPAEPKPPIWIRRNYVRLTSSDVNALPAPIP